MQWIKLTNFRIPRLEYAVTREYPWPHINLVAFIISAIALLCLTFVNIHAVGYESVSILDDYRSPAQWSWWSIFSRQSSPSCDPHQILQGDTFLTNMSTFNYVVDHINATANTVASYSIEHDALSGLEYSANPLAIACDEQNGDSRKLRVRADRLQSTVIGSVQFKCSFTTSVMVVTASYTTFDVGSSLNPLGSNLGLGNNVSILLDMLATDLMVGMAIESVDSLNIAAIQQCHDGQDLTPAVLEECNNKPANLTTYLSGISLATTITQRDLNSITLGRARNYFHALLAASFADTGIWHNNSIFISPDIVNATLEGGGPYTDKIRTGNYSTLTPMPAVISVPYACHYQRRKSPLNLVISVLVADLTLFATFWAAFTFIASAIARSKDPLDLEKYMGMGTAAPSLAYISEALPMVSRSPATEYIELQTATLALSSTLPKSCGDSIEESMVRLMGEPQILQ